MIFSLDVIPARKGDCLILHYGTKDDPHMVLIDGGPARVYGDHLRHRLEQIQQTRPLKDEAPLSVDLIMVSHVDDDHIWGIIDLTNELREPNKPKLIQMLLGVWHNSFDNIIKEPPEKLTAVFDAKLGTASMEGELSETLTDESDIDVETLRSSLKILQSIPKGAQLRKNVEALNYPLNPFFDDGKEKLVSARKNPVPMENGLTFTVVGPMVEELEALRKEHQTWLKGLAKQGLKPDDVLSAYSDPSVTNASSIVVLAKVDDKTMLLTGDALGDKVLKGLELVGLLENGELHVDILKVPHHGSSNNVEVDFFKRIIAKHYVFSGNGEHGNPERETLKMLLKAREDADYKVHFTYPIEDIDKAREADWLKMQKMEKNRQLKHPEKKVDIRPDWSHEKQSLATFLKNNESFLKKIKTVPDDEPYLIDLLDKVETGL